MCFCYLYAYHIEWRTYPISTVNVFRICIGFDFDDVGAAERIDHFRKIDTLVPLVFDDALLFQVPLLLFLL